AQFMPNMLLQVDAFTNRPFGGNPAAVCLLDGPADEGWMQTVAMEMNLSETAFVHPEGDALRLRWFTPAVEVDLCGHATLAAAHALWEEGRLAPDQTARFLTRSGPLAATRRDAWIELDFPAEPEERSEAVPGLARALGVTPKHVGRNRLDYLVELDSEAAVRAVAPDFRALATIPTRGVIVTARADGPEFDFVSRFFAPRVGVDEDPVCGSAHCYLGPYWADRLHKPDLLAHQISPRTGVLRVRPAGRRVAIAGQAVTVLRGTLV
ncbi:MAG TPA: PhzF family phenazine biosynthesis protein, partial [Isosphaeraceae bacterium]|nr:PhzF family phenazine biosynthesis protein [Isosphaeraceae bacterium]